MMSDNLSRIFPNISLNIVGVSLDSSQIFAISATLIVLPTVWLRDLSLLSYLSGSFVYIKDHKSLQYNFEIRSFFNICVPFF